MQGLRHGPCTRRPRPEASHESRESWNSAQRRWLLKSRKIGRVDVFARTSSCLLLQISHYSREDSLDNTKNCIIPAKTRPRIQHSNYPRIRERVFAKFAPLSQHLCTPLRGGARQSPERGGQKPISSQGLRDTKRQNRSHNDFNASYPLRSVWRGGS